MRKQAVSNAADSPMQWLEQIAHLAQSARNATLLVERVLHLLGDAVEAIAGAVVLTGEAGRRPQEWCSTSGSPMASRPCWRCRSERSRTAPALADVN